ncbi:P-loop containing nucleoside triphosphate hydrolase protein [Ochromonadaceae sp. CCMP2298]|nr:P-loop containing nucleoside triphosphate hydrolase protein [Ochromonadaceae sp. CCMP2298]
MQVQMLVEDEPDIECSGLGEPIFTDQDGNKFFTSYSASDLVVRLCECVRVALADDDIENQKAFAFGQVLAIYEDSSEQLYIEVRWFSQGSEITAAHRKIINPLPNELIESDCLDDIPAGSVVEVVDIKGADPGKGRLGTYYVVRFLESRASQTLQKVAAPSLQQRGLSYSHYRYAYLELASKTEQLTDPFSLAIQRLHISVIPASLPCRSFQRTTVEDYIRGGLDAASTKPLYICGMTGTGKTATVLASVEALRKQAQSGKLADFNFIEINCLKLKCPTDAYTLLWRGLTGVYLPAKSAHKRLLQHFDGTERRGGPGGSAGGTVTVCLVDEMDYLLTRNFEIIYYFYSLPYVAHSRFVLVGIANTFDLPERLSTRLSSRAAEVGISRLIFEPYNHEQIKEILEKRLSELDLKAIDSRAREFIARKAAAVAGDLRAALRICQRTVEKYRDLSQEMDMLAKAKKSRGGGGGGGASIGFKEIIGIAKEAVDGYKTTPFLATAARACQLDKALLVVMGRHRQQVTGGEGESPEASMTCDSIWERLHDLLQKIEAERYFVGGGDKGPGTGVAVVGVCVDAGAGVGGIAHLHLHAPPFAVFTQALARLCRHGIVLQAPSWKLLGGPRSLLYSLHCNFSYSDLLAALAGDPLFKFGLA